jgi:hypothetical protein
VIVGHRDRVLRVGGLGLAFAFALGGPLASALPAQGTSCDGLRVRSITIIRSEPPETDPRVPDWMVSAARAALQSPTTHAAAVRPFVLMREGGWCTELRRRETERVLRAQPYLADASVQAVPDGDGGVDITISTVDEVARVLGGRVSEKGLTGVGVGSNNVRGQGVRVVGEWADGGGYPDGLRGEVVLAQTLGQPHRLRTMVERKPMGNRFVASWERPFWSPVQRLGWFVGADAFDGNARFVRPDGLPLALPVENRRLDAGGVFRIGGETFGMFAGPFVTHDRFEAGSSARRIGPNGFESDPDTTLNDRFQAFESARGSLVVGGRWINFLRVEGLDALEGPQDIGRGVQAVLLSGVGFGGDAQTRYRGGEVFVGAGASRSYVAMRGFWERRAAEDGDSDVLAAARVRWHLKLSPDELWTLSAEFAGGWQKRRPFQLTLGDADAGVRGFRGAPVVGAHRAVLRGDYRRNVGGWGERVALAWSTFADIGAVDAGDVPYGRSSGPQASVGMALLAAVPRQSSRVWRLEVALPLGAQAPGTTELRFGMSTPWQDFWRDASDVRAVRAIIPPASLLGFP